MPAGRHPTVVRILTLNSADRSDADHTPLFVVQDLPAVFLQLLRSIRGEAKANVKGLSTYGLFILDQTPTAAA